MGLYVFTLSSYENEKLRKGNQFPPPGTCDKPPKPLPLFAVSVTALDKLRLRLFNDKTFISENLGCFGKSVMPQILISSKPELDALRCYSYNINLTDIRVIITYYSMSPSNLRF